jgi:hypothetical protein
MYFTIQELEDIFETYQAHGSTNNSKVLAKISTQYTYCCLCNHLILNNQFQKHFDSHDDHYTDSPFLLD